MASGLSVTLLTQDSLIALLRSRQQWQPGDYIQPMCWSGGGEGSRQTLKVTQRHEDVWGVWYRAVDSEGHEQEVYVSDDPRPASEDDQLEYLHGADL